MKWGIFLHRSIWVESGGRGWGRGERRKVREERRGERGEERENRLKEEERGRVTKLVTFLNE